LARVAYDRLADTKVLIKDAGIAVPTITTAGTGTARFAVEHAAVDEIQPGSYCVMDSSYSSVEPSFENALFILTGVLSVNRRDAQAIRCGDLVFVAGQVALDPKTNQPSGGDVAAQTRRVLDNIGAILQHAGTSLAYALDSLVFLRSASDFDAFNDAYRAYFPTDGPPRTTVQAAVPREGFLVEIRIIAGMPEIGRASCRERGKIWVVEGGVKKNSSTQ